MAENIKGRKPDAEKFRMKSKTNSIQYYSTEQAVQHMLSAGIDKNIMAENMLASHEIDRGEIDEESIYNNNYRDSKFDILDKGRGASEKIRTEVQNSKQNRRQSTSGENSE